MDGKEMKSEGEKVPLPMRIVWKNQYATYGNEKIKSINFLNRITLVSFASVRQRMRVDSRMDKKKNQPNIIMLMFLMIEKCPVCIKSFFKNSFNSFF